MKYQIKDIKAWGEIIIDDDQTFEELIEFYLPFRLSEIDPDIIQKAEVVKEKYYPDYKPDSNVALKLNPKGPRLFDVEEYINDNLVSEPEIKEWMEQFYLSYYSKSLPSLYVALAVHADKSKDDRVLAMDIVHCLVGKIRYGGIETMEGWQERVLKTIFAEQVAVQWGDRDVAGFIMADVLTRSDCLFNLRESVDDYFFGALSDLVGVECYFDRILEMIEEDEEPVFSYGEADEIPYIIDVAKKSLDYLDDDTWARELYKKTLDYYDIANTESEYILEMSKSIIEDLRDKKWAEEVANSLSMWNEKKEVLEAVKDNGYILSNASEELQADKDVVMAAVKNNGSALQYASDELQADKEVVLMAVKQNAYALESASKELRADREVVLAAVNEDGFALQYASEELRADKDVVLAAVRNNGDALEFASDESKGDKEVVLAAVKEDGDALEYADDSLKNNPEFMKEVEQYLTD